MNEHSDTQIILTYSVRFIHYMCVCGLCYIASSYEMPEVFIHGYRRMYETKYDRDCRFDHLNHNYTIFFSSQHIHLLYEKIWAQIEKKMASWRKLYYLLIGVYLLHDDYSVCMQISPWIGEMTQHKHPMIRFCSKRQSSEQLNDLHDNYCVCVVIFERSWTAAFICLNSM